MLTECSDVLSILKLMWSPIHVRLIVISIYGTDTLIMSSLTILKGTMNKLYDKTNHETINIAWSFDNKFLRKFLEIVPTAEGSIYTN